LIQRLLFDGHVDELRVDVMPVLLGAGARLFVDADLAAVRLEKTGVQEIGARTSLQFRVGR
jgi:dihydrofolate reductase